MLYQPLARLLGADRIVWLSAVFVFLLAAVALKIPFPFLPRDHGRAYAVNGAESKGKTRGVGLIMAICFLLCGALFLPLTAEAGFYALLFLVEMFSGYLDDASEVPWSDYKKGAIDLLVSVLTAVNFVLHNPTTICFGTHVVTLHPVLFGVLTAVLVWVSINAVNCTDGVDGLSSSLGILSITSMLAIYPSAFTGAYLGYGILYAAVLLAYLLFNAGPSSLLMGDAGSRPLGLLLSLLAIRSGHPFCYLLLCAVFLLDGVLGLIKIFLKRFLHISILKNTRTPLHDEVRKNRGWSDTQTVIRFCILQAFFSVLWLLSGL